MKKLTILIALFFSVNCFSQKRCFIIGYTAIETKTGTTWSGGYDTCMDKYPNLYQFIDLVERRFKIEAVRVLGITELSTADRKQFYKSYTPKPSPVPALDTLSPIPDSIEFISKRHVAQARRNLDEALRKMEDQLTVSQYRKLTEGIEAAFGEIISVAEQDYRKKKKK